MLTDLVIRNFAIIDNLHVSFRPGLNVLTGETGAGKSIIIDAVNLILGGRASAGMIRTGEEEAVVECMFDVAGDDVIRAGLTEAGVDTEGKLLVKRTVSRSGKNRVFMNGGMATTSLLTALAPLLVNIYGQHESQTLLKPENHLRLLDGFGGLAPLRERYRGLHDEYRKNLEDLRRLDEGEREASRRLDLLVFQSREIGDADPRQGEDAELEEERLRLLHREKLIRASRGAYEALYGGDGAILGCLRDIVDEVSDAGEVDAALNPFAARLNEAYLVLEDAALSLRDYGNRIEDDPSRQQEVDDRLDLIRKLKRKYGATIEEVLAFKAGIDRELETLTHREERRGELEECLRELESGLRETGSELSLARREATGRLEKAMERELAELAMKNARLQVLLSPHDEPRPHGLERVEFLFSPNPGESPKPMARIASGGELSRLMLALKQIDPESDVPTLVFDEVDSGIGGAVSAMVGRKLKRVARTQQVLCITHLPQVAAFADHHYRVTKVTDRGRTRTRLELLEGDVRVAEMARMLGGAKITEKTLEHAREMIEDGILEES